MKEPRAMFMVACSIHEPGTHEVKVTEDLTHVAVLLGEGYLVGFIVASVLARKIRCPFCQEKLEMK